MVDFWRQVPDGALDAVRDAEWIERGVMSCMRSQQLECYAELKRVAPLATANFSTSGV
ncbi:hypothetical protein H9P43_004009 [Blastocladiella emersonii ATCC 22665]|nr:hypothetical protein H9P43_004009 [Blastocladiella emersonii ATCC 22665]